MKKLTVFYDPNCGVCSSFRDWMGREPAFVAIEFLPYDSRQAAELCPGLLERGADKKIIVMADDGRLWQGAEGWVLCLWALRRWRGWSKRLAKPLLLPIAEKVCGLISSNRLALSRLLHLKGDREIASAVEQMGESGVTGSWALDRAKLAVRKEER
jgi:predicted DCC family thiol-disulfide oxidoreductase YuxK